jgi:TolB-like protein/DNA-binding winged helix-turn-helix (wHTH) protein
MVPKVPASLRIGDWRVSPEVCELARNGEIARLDERAMRLLLYLAERPGEIVSIDELLDQVWSGVAVSSDSVYQAVASLRRTLGDDPKNSKYIANVPRLGYRMVAQVTQESEAPLSGGSEQIAGSLGRPPHPALWRQKMAWIAGSSLLIVALIVGYFLLRGPTAHANRPPAPPVPSSTSVAVLPILDLTPGMQDEEFADGITEELIDKLSKVSGFQVPPPTSSFALKGKQVSAADAARALGVAYVLDGSVRKSGTWVRVDVRLIRASTGFVVWTDTYDQPKSDILTIQDDISNKVTAALKSSIGGSPGQEQPGSGTGR